MGPLFSTTDGSDWYHVCSARNIYLYFVLFGTTCSSPAGVIEQNTNALCMTFVEYIEGARLFLENEGEKEVPILQEIRLHFAEFCRHLIRNTPSMFKGNPYLL